MLMVTRLQLTTLQSCLASFPEIYIVTEFPAIVQRYTAQQSLTKPSNLGSEEVWESGTKLLLP